jgi:hypothetical protein
MLANGYKRPIPNVPLAVGIFAGLVVLDQIYKAVAGALRCVMLHWGLVFCCGVAMRLCRAVDGGVRMAGGCATSSFSSSAPFVLCVSTTPLQLFTRPQPLLTSTPSHHSLRPNRSISQRPGDDHHAPKVSVTFEESGFDGPPTANITTSKGAWCKDVCERRLWGSFIGWSVGWLMSGWVGGWRGGLGSVSWLVGGEVDGSSSTD